MNPRDSGAATRSNSTSERIPTALSKVSWKPSGDSRIPVTSRNSIPGFGKSGIAFT